MSEYKFACPGCGQHIAVNDDYAGYQINCPACQAPIVVPANPAAPTDPAAPSSIAISAPPGAFQPPAPPKATRLGVSGLSSTQPHTSVPVPTPEQQGSASFRAHMANKPKKSYTGLIASLAAVALIGLSAYINRDTLSAKWKAYHGPSAAEIAAATNQPAPPPPELTAPEIMEKVAETYKALPSFGSTGKSTAILDRSALGAALAARGPVTVSGDLSLKMSKPLSFRIDLTLPTALSNTTMSGWSLGNGDFFQANNRRSPVPNHDTLFKSLNLGAIAGVNVGVGEIVRLFINDTTEGLAQPSLEWSRNPDENLNGQPCYVLAGIVRLQNVLVWVSRKSFLIPQTQVVLDGKSGMAALDDAKLKEELKAQNKGLEPTVPQIAAVKTMLKTTGTVTETYGNIQTNLTLAMTDLQPPAPVIPTNKPAPNGPGAYGDGGMGGNPGPGGGGGGGGRGGGGRGGGRGGGGRGR